MISLDQYQGLLVIFVVIGVIGFLLVVIGMGSGDDADNNQEHKW